MLLCIASTKLLTAHTHTRTQKVLDALDPDAIAASLQKHEELLKEHSASLKSQSQSLDETEKALKVTSSTVSELDGKIGEMSAQLGEFIERVKVLEVRQLAMLVCICKIVCTACLIKP